MPFGNGVNWSGNSTEQSAKAGTFDFIVTWSDVSTDRVPLSSGMNIPGAEVAKSLVTAWNKEGATSPGTVAVGFDDRWVPGGTVMLFDRGGRTVEKVEIKFPDGSQTKVPDDIGPLGYGTTVNVYGLSLCRVRPHILHPPS